MKKLIFSAFLIFGVSAAAEDTPCGPGVKGAPHSNGGGFVAATAFVAKTAFVGLRRLFAAMRRFGTMRGFPTMWRFSALRRFPAMCGLRLVQAVKMAPDPPDRLADPLDRLDIEKKKKKKNILLIITAA